MTTATHYSAADFTVMPWKNGGGTTTELARDTAEADYGWRLSIADIAGDGQFSTFPGMQRIITVLEGGGMRLTVDGKASRNLLPFDAYPFDGGSGTECVLLEGPIRDFNLIHRQDSFTSRAEWFSVPDTRTFLTAADTVLIYSTGAGTVVQTSSGAEITLGRGELLRLDSTGSLYEVSLHGTAGGHCGIFELSRR
ncbi:HutD/Ves family protein [Arthrobacter monumenti]